MENFYIYISVFFTLYLLTKHFITSKLQNLPPSPYLSLPIIGHLYLLKKPLHRTLSKFSNKHGPLLLFHFGSRPVLVVSSPSLAEECFTKNDIVFANRPRLIIGKHLGYNYNSLVWASYGDHWRNLRRISSLQLLSTHRLQTLSSIRVDEVNSLIRLLTSKENQIVDMRTLFFELTLNVMMRMIAGKRYYGETVAEEEEAKRFRQIQVETFVLSGTPNFGDFVPIMKWIGPKRMEKRLIELQLKRNEFMQNLIEEHRKKFSDNSSETQGKKKNMIEVLLSLQETEPEYYKDEMIRALVLVLLLAGTDSSANTLEWALSLLLNHPKVLNKVQEEIDNMVGQNRLINESDFSRLPYFRGIISETLRMYPPGPLLMPHESSQDCSVGGYHIPKGTTLFVNLWAIQNDPKIWLDAREFKPERFEGFEGMRDGFRFMPFGTGRRGCPGEGLAMCIVGLALGSLIQCFEWEKACEDMVDMKERAGLNFAKDQPLYAKCRPRQGMIEVISQI